MKAIGRVECGFPEKFGLPRQSGVSEEFRGRIVFEPEYAVSEAFRGLEGFSHIWVVWEFSETKTESFSPTVRPPRLGGKKRVGVFASRSPYRPNPIAISCVRLEKITRDKKQGTVLEISGIDMKDGTPVYDIKPYVPFPDCRPDASEGYTAETRKKRLTVETSDEAKKALGDKAEAAAEFIAEDPRPAYDKDPERVYGALFGGFDVKFTVKDGAAVIIKAEKR